MTNEVQVKETPKIVEGLKAAVDFAGIAAQPVVNYMNKKADEDVIRQVDNFYNGKAISDDATHKGAMAHAKLAIQNRNIQTKAKLAQIAREHPDDEELWQQSLKNEYQGMTDFIQNDIPYFKDDPEITKLASIEMADDLGELNAIRASAGVEKELNGRSLQLQEFIQNSSSLSADNLIKQVNSKAAELNLSNERKGQILVSAALSSGNLNLLRNVANAKLDKDQPTLGEQSGQLTNALRQAEQAQFQQTEAEKANLTQGAVDNLTSGNWTPSQFMDYMNKYEKEYNKPLMTATQIRSTLSKAQDDAFSKNYTQTIAMTAMSGKKWSPSLKKEQKQAAAKGMFDYYYNIEMNRDPSKANDPNYQKTARLNAVRQTDNAMVAQDGTLVVDEWKTSATAAMSRSPEMVISKDADGKEVLNPQVMAALNTVIALPANRWDDYVGDNMAFFSSFKAELEASTDPATAYRRAYENSTRPKPVNSKLDREMLEGGINQAMNHLFRPNISAYNKEVMMSRLNVQTNKWVNKEDPKAKDDVEKIVTKNWSQFKNGQAIEFSNGVLTRKTGLMDINKVDRAMTYQKELYKDSIADALADSNYSQDDCFWVGNKATSTMTLFTPRGQPIAGTTTTLEKLGQNFTKEQMRLDDVARERRKNAPIDRGTTIANYLTKDNNPFYVEWRK